MRFRMLTTLAAAGLLTAATPVVAVSAQEAAPEAQITAPASAADFTEAQISAFAQAYVQVAQIGMAYDQQIQAAGSEEEQLQLQQQAQGEMVTAIEGVEGITVEDYQGIFVVAQNDVQFANQVQAAINELTGQPQIDAGGDDMSEEG